MAESGEAETDPESVNHSERQSQRLAAEMDHWLVLFDEEMALDEMPLSKRPMRALNLLFEYDAIEMRAGDERLDGRDLAKHADEIWFRVLYAAIDYWYRDRYGPAAMKPSGNAPLEGVVLVRGIPFALKMPANRRKVAIEGQQSWMYFEEGLGDGEAAETWIIDAPDLMKLDEAARDEVRAHAVAVASALRFVEFRRVTRRADGDAEAGKLIVSTLTYLQQAARRMVSGQDADRGPGWFDLQMANESALKAVIRLNTGEQPKKHDLKLLLGLASRHGVTFDPARLDDWPPFADLSDWRYGQGEPGWLETQYRAYLLTLDLVRAAMDTIKPGMNPGFGLLLRYPPWLSDERPASAKPTKKT